MDIHDPSTGNTGVVYPLIPVFPWPKRESSARIQGLLCPPKLVLLKSRAEPALRSPLIRVTSFYLQSSDFYLGFNSLFAIPHSPFFPRARGLASGPGSKDRCEGVQTGHPASKPDDRLLYSDESSAGLFWRLTNEDELPVDDEV